MNNSSKGYLKGVTFILIIVSIFYLTSCDYINSFQSPNHPSIKITDVLIKEDKLTFNIQSENYSDKSVVVLVKTEYPTEEVVLKEQLSFKTDNEEIQFSYEELQSNKKYSIEVRNYIGENSNLIRSNTFYLGEVIYDDLDEELLNQFLTIMNGYDQMLNVSYERVYDLKYRFNGEDITYNDSSIVQIYNNISHSTRVQTTNGVDKISESYSVKLDNNTLDYYSKSGTNEWKFHEIVLPDEGNTLQSLVYDNINYIEKTESDEYTIYEYHLGYAGYKNQLQYLNQYLEQPSEIINFIEIDELLSINIPVLVYVKNDLVEKITYDFTFPFFTYYDTYDFEIELENYYLNKTILNDNISDEIVIPQEVLNAKSNEE